MTDDSCKRPNCAAWHGSGDRNPARGTNEFDGTDSRETSPASEKPEWSLVVEPQAAYILRDGDLAACATSFPPGETGAKHAIPRLQRLVAAANASASPAPSAEGLAGLSQALPAEVFNTVRRCFEIGAAWDKVAADLTEEILALFRESRESRPPVATSDYLLVRVRRFLQASAKVRADAARDNVAIANDVRVRSEFAESILDFIDGLPAAPAEGEVEKRQMQWGTRRDPSPAAPAESVECKYCGFSGTAEGVEMHPCDRRDAAKSERCEWSTREGRPCGLGRWKHDEIAKNAGLPHTFVPPPTVEEPRCAYVFKADGEPCDRPESGHDERMMSEPHPFTAVPPVARESVSGPRYGPTTAGGYAHLARESEEKPQCFCDERAAKTNSDAPAASPRRSAIEKMRVEQQNAETSWFLFKTGAPEYKDVNLAGFVQHALGFGAATLAAMECER